MLHLLYKTQYKTQMDVVSSSCQKQPELLLFSVDTYNIYFIYLVGRGYLLAINGECHQAGGQVYQTADLQVHVAAARGVSSAGHIATPHHVAVTPLHTVRAQKSLLHSVLTHILIKKLKPHRSAFRISI